jgi:hypothetical protein
MSLALCVLAALYLLAGVGMCLQARTDGVPVLGRAVVIVLWLPVLVGSLVFAAGEWAWGKLRRRRPDEEEE